MTGCAEAFRTAVVDGGALGAVAFDGARQVVAGYAHDDLVNPRLLDLLLGTSRPMSPLAGSARELMVITGERALFGAVIGRGEVVVVATPAAMSVALGWALVRMLAAAVEQR